jgi:hypothetical protein
MTTSTLLSYSQLEQLWTANGGPASAAPMAAAIAMAESGGCPTSVAGAGCGGNPSQSTDTNGGSYGLWQINGSHDGVDGAAPAKGGPLPGSSWINSMFNPAANAKEAISISQNGTNWSAWSTYKNGAYKQYLNGGSGSNAVLTSAAASTPGSSLSTCVLQAPGFLFFSGPCFLTEGGVKWLKGAFFLTAGSMLGIFGVLVLAAYGFEASGAKGAIQKTRQSPVGHPLRTIRHPVQAAKGATPKGSDQPRTIASDKRKIEDAQRKGQRSVKMEDVDDAAAEERERREGFPGYTTRKRASTRTPANLIPVRGRKAAKHKGTKLPSRAKATGARASGAASAAEAAPLVAV